jgi:hypothetical protein
MVATIVLALGAVNDVARAEEPKVIYTPIVQSNDPAPGMGGEFRAFPYHSVINDADEVVFLGLATAGEGLFLAQNKTIAQVVQANQPAPGYPQGVTILSLDINYHRPNNSGQVVFESWLAGPGIDETGVDNTNAYANWFWSNGQLTPIAQNGTPAPGISGATIRALDRTTINDLGHVAFRADLSGAVGPASDTALWYGAPGNLQLLAREGQAGPGGITYGDLNGMNFPVLSPGGKVAFLSDVIGPALGGRGALIAGDPGNLRLVARTGQAAPGAGTAYRDIMGGLTTPRINDAGQVLFGASLEDGDRALFLGTPDDLSLVARTSTAAPELADHSFDYFYDTDLNRNGQFTFRADVREAGASAKQAIYAGSDALGLGTGGGSNQDALRLIAATGQRAPGTEEGVVFTWLTDPVINKDGQVAFFGYLDGENGRGENDYGIFATGHDGELRLIARYGDEFAIAEGDVRTIAALSHAGVFGTHIVSFNSSSDLSMLIKFTDGSEGIFTATVLPEPAGAGLILLAWTALVSVRRRW